MRNHGAPVPIITPCFDSARNGCRHQCTDLTLVVGIFVRGAEVLVDGYSVSVAIIFRRRASQVRHRSGSNTDGSGRIIARCDRDVYDGCCHSSGFVYSNDDNGGGRREPRH